jgi:hypothetical protein
MWDVVSTPIHSSPGTSAAASTRNTDSPNKASCQASSVVHKSEVPFVGVLEHSNDLRDLWPRSRMIAKATLYSDAKSLFSTAFWALDVRGVHRQRLSDQALQSVIHRFPIDGGRLHDSGVDLMLQEPFGRCRSTSLGTTTSSSSRHADRHPQTRDDSITMTIESSSSVPNPLHLASSLLEWPPGKGYR